MTERSDTVCAPTNNIIKGVNLIKPAKQTTQPVKTVKEQRVSTVGTTHQENEDELEIKVLILANEANENKWEKLIGPVFHDITVSEDQYDPVTLDSIWITSATDIAVRVPADVNRYFLFSSSSI